MAANRVVILQGEPIYSEQFKLSGALTPGDLVEVNQPNPGECRRHATPAVNAEPIFADARMEMGKTIDDDYAAGDYPKLAFCKKGMKINGFVATGENLVGTEFLESNGDGSLKALATDAATDDTQRVSVIGKSAESTGGATAAKTRHAFTIV